MEWLQYSTLKNLTRDYTRTENRGETSVPLTLSIN